MVVAIVLSRVRGLRFIWYILFDGAYCLLEFCLGDFNARMATYRFYEFEGQRNTPKFLDARVTSLSFYLSLQATVAQYTSNFLMEHLYILLIPSQKKSMDKKNFFLDDFEIDSQNGIVNNKGQYKKISLSLLFAIMMVINGTNQCAKCQKTTFGLPENFFLLS